MENIARLQYKTASKYAFFYVLNEAIDSGEYFKHFADLWKTCRPDEYKVEEFADGLLIKIPFIIAFEFKVYHDAPVLKFDKAERNITIEEVKAKWQELNNTALQN